jgi:hypothetical protein
VRAEGDFGAARIGFCRRAANNLRAEWAEFAEEKASFTPGEIRCR